MEAINTTVLMEAARDCWTNVVLAAHMLAMKITNIASAETQMAPTGSMCDIITHTIWMTALIGVCSDALAKKIQSPPLSEAAAKKNNDIKRCSGSPQHLSTEDVVLPDSPT